MGVRLHVDIAFLWRLGYRHGMTNENEDEIKLTPAEESSWGQFLLNSIIIDKENDTPNGYHWFVALHHINHYKNIFPNIDFIDIQDALPKTHWLKKIDLTKAVKKPRMLADFLAGRIEEKKQTSVKRISFFGHHFEDSIDFSNFIFPVDVCFENAKFSDSVTFENAIFKGQANFKNAKFSSYTTFENAIFEINAPRFYGADINDEMFWTGIKLPKFEKANYKETNDDYKKRIKDNENAYENLSTKLGNQGKFRDEYFFFRQELNCQQKLAESRTSGLAFWLYEIFSGYGYKIGRAVWCWAIHIVLGAVVIAFIATIYGDMQFQKNLPCAISVSFANANPYAFFGFESGSLKDCYTKLDGLAPISFAIIKAIQTVLGIALLFLVVLTLRVRFRLK